MSVDGQDRVAGLEAGGPAAAWDVEVVRRRLHVDDREDQAAEDEVGDDAGGDGREPPRTRSAIEVAFSRIAFAGESEHAGHAHEPARGDRTDRVERLADRCVE